MKAKCLFFLFAAIALVPCMRGQIYFTGALMYTANASGSNSGGSGEYDTFVTPNTNNAKFTVNGSHDIAFSLSLGSNTFTVSNPGNGSSFQGLGLFFSGTAATMTGPFASAPNLAVFDSVSSGTTFSFITAGANVATYGQNSGDVSWSGATGYTVGGYVVTVSAYDYGATANNLQLSVTAVPEPASNALVGAVVALGLVLCRRRSRMFS